MIDIISEKIIFRTPEGGGTGKNFVKQTHTDTKKCLSYHLANLNSKLVTS